MNEIDYNKVSDNYEVIKLIKQREDLDKQINYLDSHALINYELEILSNDSEQIP